MKFKCEAGQELVVVGWTDPQGSRVALGALLLGYHDDGDLVYAGKVGTGFSAGVLRDLHRRLSRLEVRESPCTRGRLPTAGVHWVRPKLVAEVAFTAKQGGATASSSTCSATPTARRLCRHTPYARPRAPVATPLEWDELSRVRPDQQTTDSVRRRLAQRGDPWSGIRRHAQGLGRARRRL